MDSNFDLDSIEQLFSHCMVATMELMALHRQVVEDLCLNTSDNLDP